MAEYIEREEAKVWIANVLSLIPSTDVQPVKHGRWMYCSIEDMFHCSKCDAVAVRNTFIYCPICGARMDGDT